MIRCKDCKEDDGKYILLKIDELMEVVTRVETEKGLISEEECSVCGYSPPEEYAL